MTKTKSCLRCKEETDTLKRLPSWLANDGVKFVCEECFEAAQDWEESQKEERYSYFDGAF